MEAEMVELRKIVSSSLRESEDHSLSNSQRFQGLMDVSAKSNLIRSLKRVGSMRSIPDPIPNLESSNNNVSSSGDVYRKEEIESYSRSGNSEELTESSLSNVRSRIPRVPKPPPKRSFSSNGLVDSTENGTDPPLQKTVPPPPPPPPPLFQQQQPPPPSSVSKAPPPPPPPPPLKSLNIASAKVRRVPEVVEFYHSLMRRDSTNSRRDSTGGGNAAAEAVLASSNARDMIGVTGTEIQKTNNNGGVNHSPILAGETNNNNNGHDAGGEGGGGHELHHSVSSGGGGFDSDSRRFGSGLFS